MALAVFDDAQPHTTAEVVEVARQAWSAEVGYSAVATWLKRMVDRGTLVKDRRGQFRKAPPVEETNLALTEDDLPHFLGPGEVPPPDEESTEESDEAPLDEIGDEYDGAPEENETSDEDGEPADEPSDEDNSSDEDEMFSNDGEEEASDEEDEQP